MRASYRARSAALTGRLLQTLATLDHLLKVRQRTRVRISGIPIQVSLNVTTIIDNNQLSYDFRPVDDGQTAGGGQEDEPDPHAEVDLLVHDVEGEQAEGVVVLRSRML